VLTVLQFLLGLVLLVVGAEALVRGASKLAVAAGLTPLVIGLTIVAFGTSSPELAVSVQSSWRGQGDLALGNVVGSNIFNVLFILGVSALITPLVVARQVVRQEAPVMILMSVLLLAVALDGAVGRLDATVLVALLLAYTVFLVARSRAEAATQGKSEVSSQGAGGWDSHWTAQTALILIGLGLLVLGSDWLVNAAIDFARTLGVNELIIGLTIVAAGTSMPEVATSVMAAIRGHRDIAVGNVIGSNLFNILGVLGVSGLIAPSPLVVSPTALAFDLPVMVAVALLCLPIFFSGSVISRGEGALFLACYAAYTVFLILRSQESPLLPIYQALLIYLLLPVTFLALLFVSIRAWRQSGNSSKL
jgi:cation:H+ antiporter